MARSRRLSSGKRAPRGRLRRWLLRLVVLVGLLGGVCVAVVLGALVWLNSERGLGTVLAFGLDAANAALLGQVEVGRAEGHLLSSFTLRHVSLKDPDDVELVGADSIVVEWRPGALLHKDVLVDRVGIHGLRGALAHGPNGLNLLSILPPSGDDKEPGGGMPVDVLLRRIEVDGLVVFDPGTGADPYELLDLQLIGALDWRGGRQEISLERFTGRATNPDLGRLALDGDVVLDDGAIPELALNAKILGAELSATGAVGPTNEPDLDLTVGLGPLDLDGLQPLAELPLTGVVAAALRVRGTLDAMAIEGQIDLPQGAIELDLRGDLRARPLTYGGTLGLNEVDLSSFLTVGPGVPEGPAVGLPGRLTGRLDIRAEGTRADELKGQLEATFGVSELLGYGVDSLSLRAAVEPRLEIELQQLQLSSPLGAADLHGWSRVGEGRFGVAGQLTGVQLQQVGDRVGVAGLGGVAAADLDATGGWGGASGFWIEGAGELSASHVRAPSTSLERVRVSVDAGFGAGGPSGKVVGELTRLVAGGVPVEQTSLDLVVDASSAGGAVELRLGEQVQAQLDGRFDWSGVRPSLLARSLELVTYESTWALAQPCTVTLLEANAVQIEGLDLGGPDGRLTADGVVAPRGQSALTAAAERFKLSSLQPLLGGTPVAGEVDLGLSWSGSPTMPAVHLQVRGSGVAVDQYGPFALELGVVAMGGMTTVVVNAGGTDIEPLQLQGLVPFTIALEGAGWDPDGYLQLFAGIPLQHTYNLTSVLPQVGSLPRSRFGVTFTAAGVGRNPELKGEVRLRDVQAASLATISADVTAKLVDGEFSVAAGVQDVRDELVQAQLDGVFDLERVLAEKLDGQPVDRSRPYLSSVTADVNLVGLPVETLRLYTGALDALHGKLKGHIRMDGSARDPRVSVDLSLRGGRVGDEALQNLDLVAVVQDAVLDATLDIKARAGGELRAHVASPLDLSFARPRTTQERFGQPGLAGEIRGRGLPVGLVAGFLKGAYEPKGTLGMEGTITGSLLDPRPDVRFEMHDGGVCLSSLDVCFEHAALRASASRDAVTLEQLTMTSRPARDQPSRRAKKATGDEADEGGKVSEGWLEASGSIRLGDRAETSLDVRTRDFWLSCTRQVKVRTDVGLLVRGIYPDLRVRGGVTINMLKLELGDELRHKAWPLQRDPDLHVHRGAGVAEKERETKHGPSFLDALDLDVQLVLERNCWLYMDVSAIEGMSELGSIRPDLQLEGDVGITMRKGVLSTRGEVRTIRGNLTVLGRQFRVDQGGVTFTGATPPDPQLDVSATYRSRYGDIVVRVEGRSSAPTLKFTSEDLPDEADILSVLLFGAPAEEIRPGQGTNAADELAFVANMGAAKLNQTLGRLMGRSAVDMINLETSPSGPGSFGIEVGKALTDRVFLITRYRHGVPEDENHFEGQLEFSVSRRLYIELRYGDAGNGGVEVFFKWRR